MPTPSFQRYARGRRLDERMARAKHNAHLYVMNESYRHMVGLTLDHAAQESAEEEARFLRSSLKRDYLAIDRALANPGDVPLRRGNDARVRGISRVKARIVESAKYIPGAEHGLFGASGL